MDQTVQFVSLMASMRGGDQTAFSQVYAMVYDVLRSIAASRIRQERGALTLSPTGLVNEAFIKLIGSPLPEVTDMEQLIGIIGNAMRQVLVDMARRRDAAKRPPPGSKVTLSDVDLEGVSELDVVELDEALSRLADISPRQARVVELKFFCGLSVEEIANFLNIAVPTVVRDWRIARGWLERELG